MMLQVTKDKWGKKREGQKNITYAMHASEEEEEEKNNIKLIFGKLEIR